MKAAVFYEYGPSHVLRVEDRPTPVVKPHQVLIRVHAAGINPSDWHLRRGDFRLIPTKFPKILGSECAGVVAEVGTGINHFQPGDRVVAILGHGGGGYAEYVATDEKRVVKLPDTITFEQAAAVPVTGITALQALRDIGEVRPGEVWPNEHVLVNGASGGVGVMGVQIARILGSSVTAVCSAPNAELVTRLGAHRAIDYKTNDFTKQNDQYAVVFDTVGSRTFGACKRVLTPNGTYVSPVPSPGLLAQAVLTWFARPKARFIGARDRADDVRWLIEQMEQGHLHAVIDQTYPLTEVARAHDYSESGRVRGKLVLKI